jgi:hypothetical protein
MLLGLRVAILYDDIMLLEARRIYLLKKKIEIAI